MAAATALPYTTGDDCDDRAFQVAPGPCSADTNAHSHWRKHDCEEDDPYHGGFVHEVCGACSNNTDSQPWAQDGHRDIYDPPFPGNNPFTPPVWPWPAGTVGNWTGFLTRLCKECEHREQQRLYERSTNPFGMYSRAPANVNEMAHWPRNSCTCKHFLGRQGPTPGAGGLADDRWCIRHRQDKWNTIIAQRNANDLWLRETAKDQNGVVCCASKRTQDARNTRKRKAHRACRCGAEPDTPLQPAGPGVAPRAGCEVWQCLGCEGLAHLVDPGPPLSRYQGP